MYLSAPIPLHLGVWQIAVPSSQSGRELAEMSEPPQFSWVVTAVRRNKVIVQKGLSLRHLLQTCLTASGAEWPPLQAASGMPRSAIHLTLFLPDDQFHAFKMPCMPQWGPQDIEAECRLEAARLMRLPLEALILDFEVQAAPEGALVAHVMVCENNLVQDALVMFEKLGFKLNSLSAHSDLQAYAIGWKVSPELLNAMVHQTAATC